MIKVLFDLKKEYYLNSLFPLYKELAKDPNYDLYLKVGKDQKRFLGIFLMSKKNKIEKKMIEDGYKLTDETKGFDLIICGDALKNPQKYDKEAIKVHLDHGVGIKTLRIRNIVKQKDVRYHVFLEGQYWYDYIKSLNWQDKAIFYTNTGIPKLDPFFWKDQYDNGTLIKKIGLNPKKKTVLFAPSYKPSCIKCTQKKLIELLPKYNIVIKLHPYSWDGKYAPHSQHRFFEKLASKNKEIFLIPEDDVDIYPYLYLADTMISDTSSVINEFLALGKHGIIYVLSYQNLNHSDGMPVLSIDPEEWLAGAFPHMHNPEDLLTAVESALNPTREMVQKLEEYRNYFFTGLDGKSGQRVKMEIDKLFEKNNK